MGFNTREWALKWLKGSIIGYLGSSEERLRKLDPLLRSLDELAKGA